MTSKISCLLVCRNKGLANPEWIRLSEHRFKSDQLSIKNHFTYFM